MSIGVAFELGILVGTVLLVCTVFLVVSRT